ncbi:hypothetical protein NIES4102_17180 [Chondrocystis sp. NIES-4102]|nr:hypothetical protein NIES4102_17180 [Chondrocystis sp. NIES-4102]
MTTINQPPNPNPEPKKANPWRLLFNRLKSSPKTLTTGVIALAALGSLGYWVTTEVVEKKLPPFLETQIGNFIERPIDLGEVKGYSLGGIEFGKSVIPATATDPDQITSQGVKIGFNLIPLLFRRTLPLNISLIQPDIYLEQDPDGEWVNLDFLPDKQDQKPLFYYDVNLNVTDAKITAVPVEQKPIIAQVDGSGRFNQANELLAYDLDAGVKQAKATVKGETFLETGKTNTKLLVKDLALADLSAILPNLPVALDKGKLNADLDVNIPSFSEINAANLQGTVNLENLTGKAKDLDSPVTAQSQLNLDGRQAKVLKTQATLGNITAKVAGKVDLERGYDLDLNVLPFSLASLPTKLKQQIPVNLAGKVAADFKINGAIKDPEVIGKIRNIDLITVDKTQFKQVNARFRANLSKINLENLQLYPQAGGEFIAKGTIATNFRQTLEDNQEAKTNKMPLKFTFQADLPTQDLITPYYQLPPDVTVGQLQALGEVEGTIDNPQGIVKWRIPQATASNLEDLSGTGELIFAQQQLTFNDTKINYGDGIAEITGKANLDNQQWQARVEAQNLNLTPFLAEFNQPNLNFNRPVGVKTALANFNGRLDQLDLERIKGEADLNLNVDGGDVAVKTVVNSGNLQAKATTSNIRLNSFLTSLPTTTFIQGGEINTAVKLKQLLAFAKNPDLNSLTAQGNLNLLVDGEAVAVNTQVALGEIEANANTSQINLNRFVPTLPLPTNIRSSQVTAKGELKQLLAFNRDRDLSSFNARVNTDLDLANGVVKAIATLDNNQWFANINADDLSSQLLLRKFAPPDLASLEVDNLNAQAILTGNIQPLIKQAAIIPINIKQLVVNSGVQQLQAQGGLNLSNLTNNWDIASTNLDVGANLDFDELPIKQFLAVSSENNQLVAENVNFRGKADFQGKFIGKQLISAANQPGNIDLTGNLRLLDFAFNEIAFEPVVAGRLDVKPQQAITFNLQGKRDVIAANIVPCKINCRLPYLPNSIEIRQGEDTDQPVIASGDRNGELFFLDIQNFPLALLNLTPVKTAGIDGAITGTTTGDLELNLYTLAARGDLLIAQPGLGYIQGDLLQAQFNYDPTSNIAEIKSATLDLGESKYNLSAALDLKSGAINGKVDIPQAYIQDALTTLRWFNIEDVIELFNLPDYATAAAIKPAPEKETVDQSIARKLNQLRLVNRQIQANAEARKAGGIPTELNIDGKYSGEIILAGTIQTPKASFKVTGANWQWQPKKAYPNIIEPLGLVIEETQLIPIPKLELIGEVDGATVNLEQATIEVQEAVLSLKGKLSRDQLDSQIAIANLSLDNIDSFVDIPVDIAGEINLNGTIKGTATQPQLQGEVAFTEGAFNGNVLPARIAGDFIYNGTQLAFNTTAPDSIQVNTTVALPIIPGKSDRLSANININEEAFALLDVFSQNYLNWIEGQGNGQLQANARLDLNRKGIIYDLDAQGVVNLDSANILINTPFFSEAFQGTAKLTLNNQIVNVESLNGSFADKDLAATGKFPILTAVRNLDNPLTVTIPKGDIEIEELYEGGIEGKVIVTGSSLQPVIGGKVNLESGRVSLPENETAEADNVSSNIKPKISQLNIGTKAITPKQSAVITTLKDLQINLEKFRLQQNPLYKFQVDGSLILNGTADLPTNIKPKGTLVLTRADIDLLSNSFNVASDRENTIVFTPQAGIFNPSIDVTLKTEITEVKEADLTVAEAGSNEIPTPFSRLNNADTITVFLKILGETTEILPELGQANSYCNLRPNDAPLVESNQYYNANELNRLTQCFNKTALINDVNNQNQIINSSAVELNSIPNRSQGELVGLLGKKFLAFADQVRNSSQAELFDLGVNQFVVAPIRRSVLYRVDDTVVKIGKKAGLDYLRVIPNFEGIVELDEDTSVRSTYNYTLGEVRLQYEKRF